MKKLTFFLPLLVLLMACGGGGSDDTILARLQVNLSGQGGSITGRSIHIEGGGVSYTCSQSPSPNNPNDSRCVLPPQSTGNIDTPITFTSLPTGNVYTFTEVATAFPASESCSITIVDSARTDPPSPFSCTLGDITSNQLVLTIRIV